MAEPPGKRDALANRHQPPSPNVRSEPSGPDENWYIDPYAAESSGDETEWYIDPYAVQPRQSLPREASPKPPAASVGAWPTTVPNPAASSPPRRPDSGRPLRLIAMFPCLRRGGAEQWLLYLAKFLDRRRVALVRCIVVNPQGSDPELTAEFPVPVETRGRDTIERAVRDCDVLLTFGLPCDELLREARPPLLVAVAHGDGGWTKALLEKSQATCDHVVAVSHRVKEIVCNGLPTTVIYNGVDLARLAQSCPRDLVRSRFGFGPGDFVIGYVGRFSPEKRADLLIRALSELGSNYKLLLVGSGRDQAVLRDLANELIPGRYAFTTAFNYLGDYYRAMDAFGLVSDQEGFSLALLEAMMCELPVVVTSVGSVPEMIEDRVNGVVVEPHPSSIAAGVRRLAEHPAWARGVAAEGHRFAMQHGHAARMARDYEALLGRLWHEKHDSPA